MRRSISLIMVLSMLAALLTGCGDSQGNSADVDKQEGTEPVSIVIWHDKEDGVAAVLQKALDSLAPDIVVKLEKKTGLTDALKLVGNDPAAAPDMYFFAHDKIGVYAEMGILAPITDFLPQELIDNYLDNTIAAATYRGTLYQLPIYYETLLFMYNKALMDESEVPATTEELYAYMQENTGDGHYGFVEQHSTAYYGVPWIHGFGGSLISEEGVPLLDSEEVKEALDYHLKFLEYMPGESEYSTVNTLFIEGYADSTIGGPWLVPTARDAGIELGFSALPVVDETGYPLSPYAGVQGVHVLKIAAMAKHDAVARVLESITSVTLGIEMAKVSGCAPANELCYTEDSVANDEMVMTMREIASSAIPMPNIPEMDVMFVVAGNLLVAVNMKGTDIETATADNQMKAQMLISNMK